MRRLAVLSFHTSPLVQPGSGDSGGMNVYVRELGSALAQAGVACDVYTRRWADDLPAEVAVEPGFTVVHVPAGPAEVAKEDLPDLVPSFTAGVGRRLRARGGVDAIHANYWLSGVAGHALKHELGLPLVSTFHTLARVKAEGGTVDAGSTFDRVAAEVEVVACSDAILANGTEESLDLQHHYAAPLERIEIVPPGVDHAFFSPGDRDGARAALGWSSPGRISEVGGRLADKHPVLLFVGRIQPLKAPDVLLHAAAHLLADDPSLRGRLRVHVVGAPSGSGLEAPEQLHKLVAALGIADVVTFFPPQPPDRLAEHYRAADVTVVPSHNESFGLVALESQACGTPVVAAAVGGLRTAVRNGVSGELVDGHDPRGYAAAVRSVLARRELLSAGARRHASLFSWDRTADALVAAYTSAAEEMARAAQPLRSGAFGPLRALPGVRVAR